MESAQDRGTKESVPSSLTTVTPLSKYLATVLFISLPFVGGYIGYQLATETEVEGVEVIAMNENEVQNEDVAQSGKRIKVAEDTTIAMGESVSFATLWEADKPRYVVSQPELMQQGFLQESNASYYAEVAVKLNSEYVLLIISTNPAGYTNTYVVHEPSLQIVREIDDSFYPGYRTMGHINSISHWFVGADDDRTPYEIVALDNKEVRVNNYIAGISEVVYREEQPDLYYHEVCELLCSGGHVERGANGMLRVSRFRAQPGTTLRSFVDTIEVALPHEYLPYWLQ